MCKVSGADNKTADLSFADSDGLVVGSLGGRLWEWLRSFERILAGRGLKCNVPGADNRTADLLPKSLNTSQKIPKNPMSIACSTLGIAYAAALRVPPKKRGAAAKVCNSTSAVN